MTWVATAVVGGSLISGYLAKKGASDAADASLQGANTTAQAQREALNYLKEVNAVPQQFKEGALKGLGGLYGLEGGTGSQQDLIDRAISSPLYQSIMGGQKFGEEAILRNASMTGGFRSGNVQANLYDYNTQLANQALLQSYNQQLQGLTGLAGLQTNENAIAQQTSEIGKTLGLGQIAAGQAEQVGNQQLINNTMGWANLGINAYGAGVNFSDRRLKNNLEKIGEVNGHNWYMWDWNIVANKMGLKGKSEGVLADELVKTHPECIGIRHGFMIVDYIKLGIFPKEVGHA
jgi:hypothetical protein